jgi:hypothetical protein
MREESNPSACPRCVVIVARVVFDLCSISHGSPTSNRNGDIHPAVGAVGLRNSDRLKKTPENEKQPPSQLLQAIGSVAGLAYYLTLIIGLFVIWDDFFLQRRTLFDLILVIIGMVNVLAAAHLVPLVVAFRFVPAVSGDWPSRVTFSLIGSLFHLSMMIFWPDPLEGDLVLIPKWVGVGLIILAIMVWNFWWQNLRRD